MRCLTAGSSRDAKIRSVAGRGPAGRRTPPILAAALLVSLAAFAPPEAAAGDAEVVDAVIGQEAEAKGDWDAWLDRLLAAVAKDPGSPYAMAALRKVGAIHSSAGKPERVEAALDPVLSRGLRDGEIDETVRDLLTQRANARGDFDKAESYGGDRGYLRQFAVAGPFGTSESVQVHRSFGPDDAVLDPAASWVGTRGKTGWVRVAPSVAGARVEPAASLRHGSTGLVYAVARVRSAARRTVAVKGWCGDSFKVVVNGRDAVVADRERDHVPSSVWGDATLVPGWNRILVKVAGGAAFTVKLCDPQTGLPAEGLEEGDPLEAGPHPDAGPEPDPRSYRTPTERALADETADPARSAVAGFLAATDGRLWDAWKATKRGVEAFGEEKSARAANAHAAYGRLLAEFAPFSPVQRKLQAKQAFQAALRASPVHTSARVRLAEYENEDDRPDAAVKALRELAKENPTPNAWMSVARISGARGWEAEARDAARAALALQPRNADAVEFLADVEERLGDYVDVEKLQRTLLEIDRSNRGAAGALVGHLRAQGRHADALKLLEESALRWPAEWGWRRQRAEVLRAMERLDGSLAAWKELEAERPHDESAAREQGEILEVKGDREGALAAYRRSLAVEPFQPALWKAIARIEGREEDFAAGWEPDVAATIESLPSTKEFQEKYPKAVAITVLDHSVVRVNPDGSAQTFVHMVYKILDEKGVSKYGDLPNAGDLRVVRAILPDGLVTMPTGLPGRAYNMEGLAPGTVLDHRFTTFDRPHPRGYSGDQFFFQDFEFQDDPNPVLLSRFVVLTPPGMRLEPRARNFHGEPKSEQTKDGWTATVWEKRDMPRIDPEKWMPPRDEIVPHVDYSIPQDFSDLPWELLSQRADTRPSPFVEEALAKALPAGPGGAADDVAKARAIYDWVNREITGDAQTAQGPTAILMEKSGSREVLVEAMLRAAGVPVRSGRAMAWNGSGRKLATEAPNAFGGRFLWVEPRGGEPLPLFVLGHFAPFGLVPEPYRGSATFVLGEDGSRITELPEGGSPVDDATSFSIRIGADEKAVALAGSLLYRSPNGYGYKRTLVETPQDDRRKFAEQQITSYFANPTLQKFDLPRLDERGVPLEVRLEGTMSTWLSKQGDAYVAALGLPAVGAARRFCDREERTYDLVLNVRDDQVDEIEIDLGDAFDVKSLPADHVAVHDLGTYSLTWRRDARKVRVRREYHFHPARYRPDEYKPFVAWCKGIDDAEERKLELRKVR